MGEPPVETGLYFARPTESYRWWSLIIEVEGDAPFLTAKIIANRVHSNKGGRVNPGEVCWGPKIEEPEAPHD